MKTLAHSYARAFLGNPQMPLAYYFSASDFIIHVRNRRSVHEFIADSLAAVDNDCADLRELPRILRALDDAGNCFC